MASESYIGKAPAYGYFNKQTLSAPIGGSAITLDRSATDTRQLIVVVGGVVQEPETAYTLNAAGTQITFTATPDSSLTGWIIWMGTQTTGPRMMSGSITNQTALGTSPASADTFVMYDQDAGDLKKVAFSDMQSAMGDITAVTAGNGLTGGGTSGAVSLAVGAGTGITVNSGDVAMNLANANEWTAQQNFNNTTLTFDTTQDWALTANQVATLTLTGNTTFDAPTQMVDGAFYSLIIIQDGTGSRTASWNTVFKWAGGTAPTLTTTASAKDIFVWRSDGTNMYEVGRQLNVS
tara:strand:- start:65 stop:940 length:876 start_codon:yes stop_codon:yes gene_type:complete